VYWCDVDGKHNRGNLKFAVSQLENSKIEVFAVGVGRGIKTSELNFIASQPTSSHVFRVTGYNQLQSQLWNLGQKICPSEFHSLIN